jgi:RNA polymerase sigma factor (sigma-70 family)
MTNNTNNDLQIWSLVRKGDENAFKNLYSLYASLLYQYGLKLTPKTQLIEDCIQDLFIRIFKNHNNLGKTDNVKYYLVKSFRNNLVRIIDNEKKYSFEKNEQYYFETIFSAEHKIVVSEEKEENQKILVNALKKLSARQKEAIYLRYTNGLEYNEIANIMKMSIEACRNIIYRSIKSLRQEFKITTISLLVFI